jgi:ankyrin repeat protein
MGQNADSLANRLDTSEYVSGDLDFNLIIASDKGYTKEVLKLLNRDANVNATTYEGITPLMYAVQNEHLEVCKILLLNGADPNINPNNGVPALITAVKTGNLEITELLIRKGAKVNSRDDKGITSLMYASAFNMYTLADLLIYYDADVNLTDNDGNTALLVASYYGNTDIVNLLIDKQSTLEKADKKGFTALHCAAQNNNLDAAEELVSKGASIDLKNSFGYSSLSVAVLNNNSKLTQYFIEKGANVNSKISHALKPLNIARANKNDTIIQLLKAKGAQANILPAFNNYSLNFKYSVNRNDAMLGVGLGIHDSRYGMSLSAGYVERISARQVLKQDIGNTYYQYWEKRSYVYLEVTEQPSLVKWHQKNSAGIGVGGQLVYTFGSYRGTTTKPEKAFIFAPEAYTFVKLGHMVVTLGYEYMNFKLTDFSPNRFTCGVYFLIRGKQLRQPTKKVLWYI